MDSAFAMFCVRERQITSPVAPAHLPHPASNSIERTKKERRDRDCSCSPRQGAPETAWPDAPLAGARSKTAFGFARAQGSSWRFCKKQF